MMKSAELLRQGEVLLNEVLMTVGKGKAGHHDQYRLYRPTLVKKRNGPLKWSVSWECFLA